MLLYHLASVDRNYVWVFGRQNLVLDVRKVSLVLIPNRRTKSKHDLVLWDIATNAVVKLWGNGSNSRRGLQKWGRLVVGVVVGMVDCKLCRISPMTLRFHVSCGVDL
jgi:hypothetical protein